MSSSKSAQISTLVSQLKQGLITKQELFDSLQRLQHGGVEDTKAVSTHPPRSTRYPWACVTCTPLPGMHAVSLQLDGIFIPPSPTNPPK